MRNRRLDVKNYRQEFVESRDSEARKARARAAFEVDDARARAALLRRLSQPGRFNFAAILRRLLGGC